MKQHRSPGPTRVELLTAMAVLASLRNDGVALKFDSKAGMTCCTMRVLGGGASPCA